MLTVKYLNSRLDYFCKDVNNIIYDYAKEFPFIKEIQTYDRAKYSYILHDSPFIEFDSEYTYFSFYIFGRKVIRYYFESVFNKYQLSGNQ